MVHSQKENRMTGIAREVERRLLPWFRRSARDLPWRKRRTPYTVLVSEIMLQQTRVDQALPYYRRFLREFPSVRALADATPDRVLKAWEGLGYYARARHLHRLARTVMTAWKGRFPERPSDWEALPGIGAYTLAAVGSIAYGWPLAAVDGNVVRVLSRILMRDRRQPSEYAATARSLLAKDRPGECNEAWMELGALVCTPRAPACTSCPMRRVCLAAQAGRVGDYPPPRPRTIRPHIRVGAAVIRGPGGRVLITRRRDDAMLGGLWEFPGGKIEPGETMPDCIRREIREELDFEISVRTPLCVVRHAYSHFSIELHAYECRAVSGRPRAVHCAAFKWARPAEFARYAFSKADLKIIEAIRCPPRV